MAIHNIKRNVPIFALLFASMTLAGCATVDGASGSDEQSPPTTPEAVQDHSATAKPDADDSCETTDEIRFQVFEGSIINMQPRVALEEGFLAEHCLSASAVPIANTPAAISATLTGDVDVINTGPDNVVAARAEGVGLKIFGAVAERQIYSLVAREEVLGDTYEETLQNLAGGKVGVLVVGGSNEFNARAYFADAGLDPEDVTYVGLGETSTMLAGLDKGTVDAVAFFGVAQDLAVAQGHGVMVSDSRKETGDDNPIPQTHEDLGPASLVWAAQEAFLNENPEVAQRFVAAMTDASEWIRDETNRDRVYEIMRQDVRVPENIPNADRVYREMVDIYADMTTGDLNTDALAAWIDFTESSRQIESEDSVTDLTWEPAQ